MCEVVRWVNFPFVPRPVMGGVKDPVCSKIPHLGVGVLQVLFHSKIRFLGFVFAILHVLKLRE
jgi:hypothetical protein